MYHSFMWKRVEWYMYNMHVVQNGLRKDMERHDVLQ